MDRKSLAAELQRVNAALEKSKAIESEFLSIMSHEFRTPLNLIMGYAEMMRDGLLGELNGEQRKGLEQVLKCSDELLALVTRLLQASSLEARSVQIEHQEIQVSELLEELKSDYRLPEEKGLHLVWDYPPDLPVVKTDKEKLKNVLHNLIDNAVKFTEQGEVTVISRTLAQPGKVEFKIIDTGIGMPRESLAAAFERFRQLDGSMTRCHDGAGLGLYIAKKFTELLGGELDVRSEIGKGSTFTVILPVAA
jgi:signal transduction histidine kinase